MKKEAIWKKLVKLPAQWPIFKKHHILNQLANYQGNSAWRNLNVPSIGYLPPDESDDTHLYQRLITAVTSLPV